MFKRSRHNTISGFIFSQSVYELAKRTTRANGKTYHIFKPNVFGDFPGLYQNKATKVETIDKPTFLTSTCVNKRYQPLTIDMTEDKYTGRNHLRSNSKFVPDGSFF